MEMTLRVQKGKYPHVSLLEQNLEQSQGANEHTVQ